MSHFARYTYGIDLIEGETAMMNQRQPQPEGPLAGFFRDRIAWVYMKDSEKVFDGAVTQNTSQYIILNNDTMILYDRIAFIRMEEKDDAS